MRVDPIVATVPRGRASLAAPASASALTLSTLAFARIAGVVRAVSGIALGPEKRVLVANRLRRRLVELGCPDFEAYSALVAGPRAGSETETLVELITTHHTSFFREVEHFRLLEDTILPKLASRIGHLRVWSAAASSGEEVYTLAIVLAEVARREPGLSASLVGSDISRRVLALAERGIYPLRALEPVSAVLRRRYFERGIRAETGRARVQAFLRTPIEFRRINLIEAHDPRAPLQHVIFCRNVMIYFDAEARAACIERLTASLAKGGYLFVGYSESLGARLKGLEAVHHGVYRRV
jgi:chemotaxis protein methyltransferase CheR